MTKCSTKTLFHSPTSLSFINSVMCLAEILESKQNQYPHPEEESNMTRVSETTASKLIKVKFQGILSSDSPARQFVHPLLPHILTILLCSTDLFFLYYPLFE